MKPLLLKQPLPELLEIGSVSGFGRHGDRRHAKRRRGQHFRRTDRQPELRRVQLHPRQLRDGVSVRRARHGVGRQRDPDQRTHRRIGAVSGRRFWFVEKGTPVRWDITSDRFVKHYLAIVEG